MTHSGNRLLLSVALTVIALQGCHTAAPLLSAAGRDAVQAQVHLTLDSLTDAWRRVDASAVLRFYLDSARATLNGRIYDMSELPAAERQGDAKLRGQDIGPFQMFRFDVLSGDVVVASWVNQFTFIYADGHTRGPRTSANTYVWVRRGSAWRILSSHESVRPATPTSR